MLSITPFLRGGGISANLLQDDVRGRHFVLLVSLDLIFRCAERVRRALSEALSKNATHPSVMQTCLAGRINCAV